MIPDQGQQATPGHFVQRARAKVNLTLQILGKRLDGYHELDSLVAFADEADILTLVPGAASTLSVHGPMVEGLSADDSNLVLRAMQRAAEFFPELQTGHCTLDKHLPVAAGIGGGSADAGAILRLLRQANPGIGSEAAWLALAASLGADVTVCLSNQAARMTGIGDKVEALGRALDLSALLVNPMVAVPVNKTGAVFKALAAGPVVAIARPYVSRPDIFASFGNDLEAPAITVMPVIADVLAALHALPDTRLARLSGAGPTCFALFDTASAAAHAQVLLAATHPDWWIRATRLT